MMLDEQYLREISLVTAFLTGLASLGAWFAPASFARALAGFPRNRAAGIFLAAVALLWSAYLINDMTLGDKLSKYKDLLYVLTPTAFFLVLFYLDELLAARAFGGLLMLYPTIMVDIARWHPSPWRLVVVSLAYLLAIAGMWIVLSPYKFRIWTSFMFSTRRTKLVTAFISGVFTLLLLVTAYEAG